MSRKSVPHQPSCNDFVQPGLLTVDTARQKILTGMVSVTAFESLPVRETLGRVLADDIYSPINVPSHTNSAMDGYAVNSSDLPDEASQELRLIGTSWAGKPYAGSLQPGNAIRIMTGAAMPEGADTVIMQEHVERSGDAIRIGTGHIAGQNVRAAGEDLQKDQLVLSKGRCINTADLGLLGSLGLEQAAVYRRLKVAFFSTGDELCSAGEPLGPGQIYDSNRYTLFGLLTKLNVDIIDMGVVPDTREAVENAFHAASQQADVLITTGGVSVGDADFVTETLEKLGTTSFWRIAMKPGRPLAFGHYENTVFFGLPGNPVSTMVTFLQFVRPALMKMSGRTDATDTLNLKVPTVSPLRKAPGRTEFQRAVLERDIHGDLTVKSTGAQGSGILRSMSEANCFIILPAKQETVEAGDMVEVQPFADYL